MLVLKELHCALMAFRRSPSRERPQIATFAGLGIGLPRIKTVLARFEFADHGCLLQGAESGAVAKRCGPTVLCAVGAAIDLIALFDAVADNSATAMCALRRESMDGTLERVESVGLTVSRDREHFVVLIAAHFAGSHANSLLVRIHSLVVASQ